MIGPFDAMMRAGQSGGMQATPVHHTGKGTMQNPEPGSMRTEAEAFLAELEQAMSKHPAHSGAYKQLLHMRGDVINSIADMDTEHLINQSGPEGVDPLTQRYQNLKGKAAPYQRGITPEGIPAR